MKSFFKNYFFGFNFLWFIFIIIIVAFFSVHFCTTRKKNDIPLVVNEQSYHFGDVFVDLSRREVSFEGIVRKSQGRVQFLIYLQGYKWLEEQSAIVSSAYLSDLQKAIALLDWKIWEEIIHRAAGYISETKQEDRLCVTIKHKNEEVPAGDLVVADDVLRFSDFIFPGSLYFDVVALEGGGQLTDCLQCPFFPIERKILSESFIRESGESGYDLSPSEFLKEENKVTIFIRVQDGIQGWE